MDSISKTKTNIKKSLGYIGVTGRLMIPLAMFVGVIFVSGPQTADLRSTHTSDIEAERIPSLVFASASDSAADAAQLVQPMQLRLIVAPGDTLMTILVDEGIARREAHAAIAAMSKVFRPRSIRPKQEVVVTARLPLAADQPARLTKIELAASVERDIVVTRLDDNSYQAVAIDRPLTRSLAFAKGTIESSLYVAAVGAKVPLSVLAELIQIFSFDVDFQRDIRRGDGFSLMYARYLDEAGLKVRDGEIEVAAMTLGRNAMQFFRFETADGQNDYYDAKGRSARKALLRTPIDGAKMSSRFGMRRHPILGYNKMHRGLDFAAPRGTPVFAAGNGVVERAGRYGAYGKYVRLRHNSTYKTAYAHMSRYGKKIRAGRRVKQGQIIGYVGTTGRSTGPHLHYEVLQNGGRVNPQKIKLPTGRKLTGKELAKFREKLQLLERQYVALGAPTQLAKSGKTR